MSRAIALFNQAGGVGKTTITQNLGYQLSARGHKVLLIDLDPQALLTTFMVPIDSITFPASQPRRYFDPAKSVFFDRLTQRYSV